MRANSNPMPNEAPVMRAVLRSGIGRNESAFKFNNWATRKADPKTRLCAWESLHLHVGHRGFHFVDRMPRSRGLQFVIDVTDILHALGFKPLTERTRALFRVDGDAICPGCASAEDAVELHAGFPGELERLAEFCVADPSRQINEWLGHDTGGLVE